MNGLIRRSQQRLQSQFGGGVPKAARIRKSQQLSSSGVHQLQQVFAIERKQRRVHHLKNARQQRRCFQRAPPLLLQQIGQRIHLCRQFAQRIACQGSASAKGVVALAQRRHHV